MHSKVQGEDARRRAAALRASSGWSEVNIARCLDRQIRKDENGDPSRSGAAFVTLARDNHAAATRSAVPFDLRRPHAHEAKNHHGPS